MGKSKSTFIAIGGDELAADFIVDRLVDFLKDRPSGRHIPILKVVTNGPKGA